MVSDTTPIVIGITGNLGPLNSVMVEATALVQRSIATLKAAFKDANEKLRFTPTTDPNARQAIVEYRNLVGQQVLTAKENLQNLASEYESTARRIAEANKIINTPLERGPGGRFRPRDTSSPEYQRALEQRKAAETSQSSVVERMGRFSEFAQAQASAPGSFVDPARYAPRPPSVDTPVVSRTEARSVSSAPAPVVPPPAPRSVEQMRGNYQAAIEQLGANAVQGDRRAARTIQAFREELQNAGESVPVARYRGRVLPQPKADEFDTTRVSSLPLPEAARRYQEAKDQLRDPEAIAPFRRDYDRARAAQPLPFSEAKRNYQDAQEQIRDPRELRSFKRDYERSRYAESEAIVSGRDRITAATLQEQLGIPRTEVNQVLRQLEKNGVVGPAIPFQGRQVLSAPLSTTLSVPNTVATEPIPQQLPNTPVVSEAENFSKTEFSSRVPPPAAGPEEVSDAERARRAEFDARREDLQRRREAALRGHAEEEPTASAPKEANASRRLPLVRAADILEDPELSGIFDRKRRGEEVPFEEEFEARTNANVRRVTGSSPSSAPAGDPDDKNAPRRITDKNREAEAERTLTSARDADQKTSLAGTRATEQESSAQQKYMAGLRQRIAATEQGYKSASDSVKNANAVLSSYQQTVSGLEQRQADPGKVENARQRAAAYGQATDELRNRQAQLGSSLAALRNEYASLSSAQEIATRQAQTLPGIEAEIANAAGKSSAEMATVATRAGTEVTLASRALKQAQEDIGPAAEQGNGQAKAAIESLQRSVLAATSTHEQAKAKVSELAAAEEAAAGVTGRSADLNKSLRSAQDDAARSSQVLAGLQREVQTSVGQSAAEFEGVYVRSQSEARLATNNLTAAQKELGQSASAGNTDAKAAIQNLTDVRRQAIVQVSEHAARLELLKRAEAGATAETMAEARAAVEEKIALEGSAVAALRAAQAQKELGHATSGVTGHMWAASAGIQVLEGKIPLRGIERFIGQTLRLGPLLEAAFPVFGAIALAEMLGHIIESVHDAYLNFVDLKEVQEQVAQVSERLARAEEQAFERASRAMQDHLRRIGQTVEAAQDQLKNLQNKPIDLQAKLSDKQIEKDLKGLPDGIQNDLKAVFQNLVPSDLPRRIEEVTRKLNEQREAAAKARTAQNSFVANPAAAASSTGGELIGMEHDAKVAEQTGRVYEKLLNYLNQEKDAYYNSRIDLLDKINDEQGKNLVKQAELRIDTFKQAQSVTGAPSSSVPVSPGSLSLPQAIARYEGYGADPKNIPTANNNPGDLLFTPFTQKYGAVAGPTTVDKNGASRTFSKFPDAQTGFAALEELLKSSSYNSLTLAQAIERWNGKNQPNNPDYIEKVSAWTGIPAGASIATATPAGFPATGGMPPSGVSPQQPDADRFALDTWKGVLDQLTPGTDLFLQVQNKIASLSTGEGNKVIQQLRDSDSNALADLKASHALTLEEEIRFWEERLQREAGFAQRYTDIHRTLGNLYQQRDRENDKERKQQLTEAMADAREQGADSKERTGVGSGAGEALSVLQDSMAGMGEPSLADQEQVIKLQGELRRERDEDQIRADRETLDKKKIDHEVSVAEEKEYWDAIVAVADAGSKRYKQALDQQAQATSWFRAEQRDVQASRVKGRLDDSLGKLQEQEEVIRGAASMGVKPEFLGRTTGVALPQIPKPSLGAQVFSLGGARSAETREALMVGQIHQQEYQEALAANRKQQDIYKDNPKQLERLLEQQHQIEQRYNRLRVQDTIAVANAMSRTLRDMVQGVNRAFAQGINQWIFGQKTFTQSMIAAWNGMMQSIILDIEKIGLKWIEEHIIMAAVAKAMKALGIDDSGAAAAARTEEQIALNNKEKESYITLATAEEFKYAIEESGGNVFYAAGMAALAHGLGEAVSAPMSMPGYDIGGIIPTDQVAMVHQGEAVLPRPLTDMLVDASNAPRNQFGVQPANPAAFTDAASAAPSMQITNQNAGDLHFSIHAPLTVHSPSGTQMTESQFGRMLERHEDKLGRLVQKQARRFNR